MNYIRVGFDVCPRPKTLDTNLLRHKIHRTHVTGFVANLFFSALESRFKNIWIRCRIPLMRVDRSRIRRRKRCGFNNIRIRR